jgi:plastocyanin
MRRFVTVLAQVSVIALLAVSCSSVKDTGFPSTPTPIEESSQAAGGSIDDPATLTGPIDIVDSAFVPKFVKVTAGTEVRWQQSGTLPHSVTSDDARPKLDKGEFDSSPDCSGADTASCMGAGDPFAFSFRTPGEYSYYCVIHGAPGGQGMAGVVIVE